jgi:aubergine-like protein
MTGLTDDMRANFSLMKTLSEHLHMVPAKRIDSIKSFMKDIQTEPELTKELNGWGLEFSNELTKCQGRILPKEGIIFGPGGDNKPERPNDQADWTMAFRKRQMLKCINLERWAILAPQRDAANIDNLVKVMMQVSKPLGLLIRPPTDIIKVADGRSSSYLSALDSVIKNNPQMVFVVLPNNKLDLYAVMKKRLSVNLGIPSQCFLAKNLTNKGLMSIATKVVVQMNAKLGGEPWSVQLPLKNMMVVGFDAYRGGGAIKTKEKCGIGAVVSTVNNTFSKYFSTVSNHKGLEELGSNLAMDMNKCLDAYRAENGNLPDRIIVYRDGVGDGQLRYVYDIETIQIQKSMEDYYLNAGVPKPKLTYIVVTKRINTRFFTAANGNPGPGTVVDNTVTLPERYDFYLITAAARQGTVSPCSYNVLVDTSGLEADKIQRITYKMCHLYYNWSGTVAVPAPCQYAHKLAFLTGMALGQAPSDTLNNKLHFL